MAYSQSFGMHWIHHPAPNASDQIWFRRTYTLPHRPTKAVLTVASEGRYIIYVNGYVVSNDLFSSNPEGIIAMREYNIKGLLKAGQNVVGVWYAPTQETHRQLSATLTGSYENGATFYYETDGTWLCRKANARMTANGGEEIDATRYVPAWNQERMQLLEWQAAERWKDTTWPMVSFVPMSKTAFHAHQVLRRPKRSYYGNRVIYDYGQQVNGWVRVTLRRMKRGDVVYVNGLRYVCSGQREEQACRRFTTGPAGTAIILLPAGRNRDNITRVEAISISDTERIQMK